MWPTTTADLIWQQCVDWQLSGYQKLAVVQLVKRKSRCELAESQPGPLGDGIQHTWGERCNQKLNTCRLCFSARQVSVEFWQQGDLQWINAHLLSFTGSESKFRALISLAYSDVDVQLFVYTLFRYILSLATIMWHNPWHADHNRLVMPWADWGLWARLVHPYESIS